MAKAHVCVPAYCILRTSLPGDDVCEVGYCRKPATSRMVLVRPSQGMRDGLAITCLCENCADAVELATGSTQPRPASPRSRRALGPLPKKNAPI